MTESNYKRDTVYVFALRMCTLVSGFFWIGKAWMLLVYFSSPLLLFLHALHTVFWFPQSCARRDEVQVMREVERRFGRIKPGVCCLLSFVLLSFCPSCILSFSFLFKLSCPVPVLVSSSLAVVGRQYILCKDHLQPFLFRTSVLGSNPLPVHCLSQGTGSGRMASRLCDIPPQALGLGERAQSFSDPSAASPTINFEDYLRTT